MRSQSIDTKRSMTRVLWAFAGIVSLIVVGCEQMPSNSGQSGAEVVLKLYFSGEEAMLLEPEERVAAAEGASPAELVIRELMKGPADGAAGSPVPQGAKLLGIEVVDGAARVDFSAEFRDNHSGGTTGEAHTVYAIVHSLCELEGIDAVQFLVEGAPLDTLGHMDLSEPIAPTLGGSLIR